MAFQKATRYKSKLRLAVFGPSGAGKTMTSLLIAHGIGGKIALLDSENKTASKYAGRKVGTTTLDFDTDDLGDRTVHEYIEKMHAAAEAGYEVLIVDSSSHAWKELLLEVERIAKSKYRGNTWSAWSEGNPVQNSFIDALQKWPGHVIFTMRSKTEWETEKTQDGKNRPVRIGLTPEQGKGIEYEFDMLIEMDVENHAIVIKDRSGKFQGKSIDKPGVEFGKELAAWLGEGDDVPLPPPPDPLKLEEAHMKAKLQSLGNELYQLMRTQFTKSLKEAYDFGASHGWDEELMFQALTEIRKAKEASENVKVGEEPKKAKVKKDA